MLWFETRPYVPRAAVWSAHSFPWFSAWLQMCSIVILNLNWICNRRRWQVSARGDSAQANASPRPGIAEDTRLRITGNRAIGPKEGKRLNGSAVLLEWVREICFGYDDRAKHDILPSTKRAGDSAPTSWGFALRDTSSSICVNGPSLKVVAFLTCSGSRERKIRIWLW